MDKKRKPDWTDIAGAAWKGFVVTLALFIIFILLLSALVYNGIVDVDMIPLLLYVVCGAAAFCATAFSAVFSRRQLLLKGVLTQGAFLALLLFLGMLAYESMADWFRLGVAAVVDFFAITAAVLLFGKRKKKNFQKNAAIRLKKK